MPPVALIDPATIDTSRPLYDLEAVRRGNPQRAEMEQLTAIVHVDREAGLIVGYKDVRPDEFWVHSHMPGDPLMPGGMICEAAAQLCSFYCHLVNPVSGGFLAFGGLEDVRFRGKVRPSDRLLLAGKAVRLRPRQNIFVVHAFIGNNMVFHARIIGVPLTRATDSAAQASAPKTEGKAV